MTTVIDVGCAEWGEASSIPLLVERFDPDVLLAFDPLAHNREYKIGRTRVVEKPWAAWKNEGWIGFVSDTSASHADPDGEPAVECFDLARLVAETPGPLILKLDCEGCEAVVVPHLIATGAIGHVHLLLLETHAGVDLPPIPCRVESW